MSYQQSLSMHKLSSTRQAGSFPQGWVFPACGLSHLNISTWLHCFKKLQGAECRTARAGGSGLLASHLAPSGLSSTHLTVTGPLQSPPSCKPSVQPAGCCWLSINERHRGLVSNTLLLYRWFSNLIKRQNMICLFSSYFPRNNKAGNIFLLH